MWGGLEFRAQGVEFRVSGALERELDSRGLEPRRSELEFGVRVKGFRASELRNLVVFGVYGLKCLGGLAKSLVFRVEGLIFRVDRGQNRVREEEPAT